MNIRISNNRTYIAGSGSLLLFLILIRGMLQLNLRLEVIPNPELVIHIGSFLVVIFLFVYAANISKFTVNKYYIVFLYMISVLYIILLINNYINKYFFDYLFVLLLPLLVLHLKNIDYLIKGIFLIFFSILCAQIAMAISNEGFLFFTERSGRGTLGSIFGHSNQAAFFLGLYYIYHHYKKSNNKIKILILVLLLALGGRVVLMSIAIFIVYNHFDFRRNFIYIYYISIVIILIFLSNYFEYTYDNNLFSFNSLKWRLQHWFLYYSQLNNPYEYIFGMGYGEYVNVSYMFYGYFIEVHNDYLRMVYDGGVITLLIIIGSLLGQKYLFVDNQYENKIFISYLSYLMFNMMFDNLITNFMVILVYCIFLKTIKTKK